MASSEVQQAFSTNGHFHTADDQDDPHPCDVEHEDTTSSSLVQSTDRPEQDTPETGLEEAGTAQHEQLRSAQPEEMTAPPVLDDPPAAVSSKHKFTASPTKRPTPTVQTATTKGASGPPTPQVKKVFTYFFAMSRGYCFGCLFRTLFLTRTLRIADFELG